MNILLTSVGRRAYLIDYFKSAFKGKGLVHASNLVETYSLKVADKSVLSPQIFSREYITFLIEYCLSNNVKAIVSLFDVDLQTLANHKLEFKRNGIEVIVSKPEVIKICNDKWETYKFLKTSGFNTPKTYIDVRLAKSDIESGELSYPVILKPRWGMGSIGVYKAENEIELEVFYNKIQREIQNTYLKYESCQDKNRAVIIQQFISGDEYGLEVVNDLDANYVATLSKKKIAMRAGETDQAEIVINEEFDWLGNRISTYLGHVANLDVDVLEENGVFFVLEMNARFGGQYPFSHVAGADLPLQIRYWLENKDTEPSLFNIENGVVASKDLNIVRLN
ncbi:ATP-grasp domain-containing protein [Vibrio breoganii]